MVSQSGLPGLPANYFDGLREPLRGGVQRWLEAGIQPGSFLSSVIANDLKESFRCADDSNLASMREIVAWFYNKMPMPAWGSVANAEKWAARYGRKFDWIGK
jgi:hypothetical protein